MQKVDPLINSLNGGEVSPKLDAKIDLQKYASSCRVMENFIPMVEGGVLARPGLYFVAELKDSTKKGRLIPFQYSTVQAYVVCAEEGCFRFFKDSGQIIVAYSAWLTGTAYAIGNLVTNSGNYYRCIVSHTSGTFATDLTANKWVATAGGADIAYEIPSIETETTIPELKITQSADVLYMAHRSHVIKKLSRTAHTTWAVTDFGGAPFLTSGNFPGAIAFFEQRFMVGGTLNNPLDVWGSVSGSFEDFTLDPTDDSAALQYSLLSDKVDAINWLMGEEYLMVGTAGGVWRLGASSTSNPLTATDVVAKRQLANGVMDIDAEMVNDSILYVQRGGTTVRKAAWEWTKDKYTGLDVTRIAKHIAKGATSALSGITDMDYQSEPMSILWAIRADGTLLGMVYEPDENVYPWFRITTDGEFESVATITAEGEEDQVWVIVKRTIGGATKRYVEYFKPHDFFNVYKDAFFVDSGLTWEGDAAVEITAISQAAECTITAANTLADGNKVRFLNTGTWLDNHVCTVSDRAAGSFKIKDEAGTAYIDSTAFTSYPPTTSTTTYLGETQSIIAIAHSNPAKIVCPNHGLIATTPVRISGVLGMTTANGDWIVSNPTDDTFEIALDSITLPSYAGSGIVTPGATVTAGNGTVEQVAKTLSGLSHLEGKSVAVFTDQGKHPARTVASGAIALSFYANKISVGLPYDYNLQPMKIESPTAEGTSRGRKKKIYSISASFYQSAGVKWGPDADNLSDVPFGTGGQPALFTGDKETDFDMDYEAGASVYIQGQSPLPCSILSISPKMVMTDG